MAAQTSPSIQEAELQALRHQIAAQERELEALHAQIRQHHFLARHANDIIARHAPDGMCLAISPSCTSLLGYAPEEIVGTLPFDLVHPDDHPLLAESIARVQDNDADRLMYRLRHKEGHYLWVETTARCVRDPETGEPQQVFAIIRDVTERVRAEEAQARYAARLEHLSRQLVEIQERERRTVALELHDDIGQILTALNLALDLPCTDLTVETNERLQRARDLVDLLTTRVRNLALDLRPTLLDDLGLLPALVWFTRRYAEQTGTSIAFKHTGLADVRFAPATETAAFRIVQETLTKRPAAFGSAAASIKAWTAQGELHLQIVQTLPASTELTSPHPSQALSGIEDRAGLADGTATVSLKAGADAVGLVVEARLPVGTARRAAEFVQ